ncbi:tRNA (adenosine(37)-N6)-threonylcarbamoyltransferase complex dimerization subunit type 1 TsaB [Campylobacter sp. VicNov18]|uniref:tRNA threonylcarbamoyladenosine biosynthesis protein TsaB n=1 Tax=Campylobacter bilis TaxID=2691918 RepID=UPI00130DB824|nr:tRNA (adenosine(37)-N6)-threonylcarbamoyltransferase complex dimerization subunit type 1 TsaB [Campylobacter bilis]MPV63014.1 tRNA threonylcarbamoyladenosine biosynthesis protein TsaB [Campylobacter hepaticus]MBM0636513.1 tRNA threonylcarbamoyladenosine biosynthesis protein TsaB [Campylobacter bilis]MCC8277223.1 tRNA (adenosine(37)-N6)-threonylcarbamoyltransferase complex dimerization subunit type 1 TsaB [Campylobacter bilis]MCC8298966.1 tRNA (adenosine(37)-N6)-threonylcarbamoyltransferase c
MIGIYQDDKLVQSYTSEEKASEFLPKILDQLLRKYNFTSLIYANGPGSYMGIKISYVSLKTLSIVKNIPLFAVSAFELNGYKPISANKNFCFVYKDKEIVLEQNIPAQFFLPKNLQDLKLNNDNLPFYFLNAI